MANRRGVVEELGGLDLTWHQPLAHHHPGQLPSYLPVLVQAYADPVDLPLVALHGGRLLGKTGMGLTPKHRTRSPREVYRLSPATRVALELYVEDRVLEGVWVHQLALFEQLARLELDLVLAPNFSVWRDASRFEQLVQMRRSLIWYARALTTGLPIVPDVAWCRPEDGAAWADWINDQEGLEAVSLFTGGKRVVAEVRGHRETVEDVARLHEMVRPEVAFVLGGVHSPHRLRDYRRVAPGRRLVICNSQAYALAQRRKLLDGREGLGSARECFLRNCGWIERVYGEVLGVGDAVEAA